MPKVINIFFGIFIALLALPASGAIRDYWWGDWDYIDVPKSGTIYNYSAPGGWNGFEHLEPDCNQSLVYMQPVTCPSVPVDTRFDAGRFYIEFEIWNDGSCAHSDNMTGQRRCSFNGHYCSPDRYWTSSGCVYCPEGSRTDVLDTNYHNDSACLFCNRNFYGTGHGCELCPMAGNSPGCDDEWDECSLHGVTDSGGKYQPNKTTCYLPAGTQVLDESGRYIVSNKCNWKV